jgi:hypothetical protein
MKNWVSRNLKNIIAIAFVIPILLVAFVSISHVTTFYGLSNPMSWAIYLSVAIEIAALSALAAVSVRMGRFVYLPFFVVTLIQMIGNIFFSFSYIDETGQTFQDWVAMVGGLFENMGIERTDYNTHKTVIAFFSGGLLPIISLTFAHMLVKFSESNKEETIQPSELTEEQITELSKKIGKEEFEKIKEEKFTPTEEEIDRIEKVLTQFQGPIETQNTDTPIKPTEEELKDMERILESMKPVQVDVTEIETEESESVIDENGVKRLKYTKQV